MDDLIIPFPILTVCHVLSSVVLSSKTWRDPTIAIISVPPRRTLFCWCLKNCKSFKVKVTICYVFNFLYWQNSLNSSDWLLEIAINTEIAIKEIAIKTEESIFNPHPFPFALEFDRHLPGLAMLRASNLIYLAFFHLWNICVLVSIGAFSLMMKNTSSLLLEAQWCEGPQNSYSQLLPHDMWTEIFIFASVLALLSRTQQLAITATPKTVYLAKGIINKQLPTTSAPLYHICYISVSLWTITHLAARTVPETS